MSVMGIGVCNDCGVLGGHRSWCSRLPGNDPVKQLCCAITRIKALEDALREVKHCMSNVNVDSRWFDRGIATINELIGE